MAIVIGESGAGCFEGSLRALAMRGNALALLITAVMPVAALAFGTDDEQDKTLVGAQILAGHGLPPLCCQPM